MNILYIGIGRFSYELLLQFINTNHNIVGCITNANDPINILTQKYNIPTLTDIKNIEIVEQWIDKIKADLGIIYFFNRKIKFYKKLKYGIINIHFSLLPKYRGKYPIKYALENNEKETGVSIILIDDNFDTGDILYAINMPIKDNDNNMTIYFKLHIVTMYAINYIIDNIELFISNKKQQT